MSLLFTNDLFYNLNNKIFVNKLVKVVKNV